MIAGFEVDCEKWKLEGGKLIIGSIERKFKTEETTVFVGVGARVGVTGLRAGAEIGGAITFQGDKVTNVAAESEVSTEALLISTSLKGRLAVEGGSGVSLENMIGFAGTGIGNI